MAPLALAATMLAPLGAAKADHLPSPAPLPPALPWSGASERLVAAADDPWITPAERSGFATSPRYAEVVGWLERLAAASPVMTLETFGRTAEGCDLVLARASKGRPGKPVVLIQSGIHAGEIDGKDAGLMLLRDIALRGKDDLLDRVDLVFVPVLNADGHEAASRWNAIDTRGPEAKGTRSTAQNINLNRDYAKADAPETRAIIALLRRLDPILYMDVHVSDGFDMQYDITFTYAGWGRYARHRATAGWLEDRFGPAAMAALERAGHLPTIYPSPIDVRDPAAGIRYAPEGPRYSTGYGDFTGIPTVLVENHMLKPYRQRVLGTYVLMETALRVAARDADRIARAKAADRASRPEELLVAWTPAEQPIGHVERFRGIAFETYRSPASGRMEQRWTGRPVTFRMPIIGQRPMQAVRLPVAWYVLAHLTEVIDRLTLHGIMFETIAVPRTLLLDQVTLRDPQWSRPSEGRVPFTAGTRHDCSMQDVPAGTLRVPADQPLGLLAASLLEPESQDSFLAWGFFPQVGSAPERAEAFVRAPLAEQALASDPALRAAFDARLSGDPIFAGDGEARLDWILQQVAPADGWFMSYPVLREAVGSDGSNGACER